MVEGWPELHWHLPLAVFGLGKQLFGRVALVIFLDDGTTGLTRYRDSTTSAPQ